MISPLRPSAATGSTLPTPQPGNEQDPASLDAEEARRLADAVEGWLTPEEGRLLYNLAKTCTGQGVIVEIGSWKGKSTIWLGRGSKAGGRVPIYAIDPHTGSAETWQMFGEVWTFDEFLANIQTADVAGLVIPLRQMSEEAARSFDKAVELIFIDGAHEYEMVRLDFELWFPKVIDGGIMAFHDADAPGPRELVEKHVLGSRHFRHGRFVHSILVAEKVSRASLKERFRNRCTLMSRRRYLPQPIRGIARRIGEWGT